MGETNQDSRFHDILNDFRFICLLLITVLNDFIYQQTNGSPESWIMRWRCASSFSFASDQACKFDLSSVIISLFICQLRIAFLVSGLWSMKYYAIVNVQVIAASQETFPFTSNTFAPVCNIMRNNRNT